MKFQKSKILELHCSHKTKTDKSEQVIRQAVIKAIHHSSLYDPKYSIHCQTSNRANANRKWKGYTSQKDIKLHLRNSRLFISLWRAAKCKVGCVFLMAVVSLYCLMRESDQMTIGKTHPTLVGPWLGWILKISVFWNSPNSLESSSSNRRF